MAIVIDGTRVERVPIVDDSDDDRDTIGDDLRDFNLTPQPLAGPFGTVDQLLQAVINGGEAAVCDHHLTPRNYAPCTGAQLLKQCYERKFPSVRVTKYEKANIDQIRPYRRSIPALIPSEDANPEMIVKGWELCVGEFKGQYVPTRKPWRTMLRVEDVIQTSNQVDVYVFVPGWNSDEAIKLSLAMFPEQLRQHVLPNERLFAVVNVGAENQEDLYFEAFEYRG